jgi:hypothetical protein
MCVAAGTHAPTAAKAAFGERHAALDQRRNFGRDGAASHFPIAPGAGITASSNMASVEGRNMRGSRIGWGAVAAACVVAAPAGATHHKTVHGKSTHHATAHHETSHHDTSHHKASTTHHATAHHGKETRHDSHAAHEDRKPVAVAGAVSVPAGGTKLYCGPGKSPLMVRKMTQGSGTTVTVICR